jgi:hypothetical protein
VKRIAQVDPGPNGVGQTVTFDDGSTEFDPYGTAVVDPTVSPDATPPPEPVSPSAAPDVTDPLSGAPIPAPTPATPEQLRSAEAFLADPVKAMGAPPNKPVELTPGIADMAPAQPEAPAPIAQVLVPGSAGGFQPASKSTQGVNAEDRGIMYDTAAQGLAAKAQGDEASISAQEGLATDLERTAMQKYLHAEANALAIAADQKRQDLINQSIQSKLQDVSKFKPDRHQLFEGTAGGFRAVLSGLGMIAGGMLSGLTGGPNHALEAVFKMVDDNVQDQVAQNTSVYQELVRRLGDEQAAAAALKQKHLQATAEMAGALEMHAKSKEVKAALAGARSRAEFESAQYALKVQSSLAPQETLNMAYRAPTAAHVLTIDNEQQRLAQLLNVKPQDVQKQTKEFMQEKIAGDKGKTVGEALQYMKELQQDMGTLRGIAAANGGNLPGVDQVLSPARSPMMRGALARLGIDHEVQASEVYKIVNSIVTKRAKSYGGAITEADKKSAENEVGVTSGQVLDFMRRMHDEANGQLKAVARGYFQGRSQPVIDILTQGIGEMQGFREDRGRPR